MFMPCLAKIFHPKMIKKIN